VHFLPSSLLLPRCDRPLFNTYVLKRSQANTVLEKPETTGSCPSLSARADQDALTVVAHSFHLPRVHSRSTPRRSFRRHIQSSRFPVQAVGHQATRMHLNRVGVQFGSGMNLYLFVMKKNYGIRTRGLAALWRGGGVPCKLSGSFLQPNSIHPCLSFAQPTSTCTGQCAIRRTQSRTTFIRLWAFWLTPCTCIRSTPEIQGLRG